MDLNAGTFNRTWLFNLAYRLTSSLTAWPTSCRAAQNDFEPRGYQCILLLGMTSTGHPIDVAILMIVSITRPSRSKLLQPNEISRDLSSMTGYAG